MRDLGFREWIIPQDRVFFDLLERQADVVSEGADALLELVTHFTDVSQKRKHLKDIEHKGDNLVHEVFERLNKTFVTPIDNDDISRLTAALDDILDYIEACAYRLYSYEVKTVPQAMIRLAETIQSSVREVNAAVKGLRTFRQSDGILARCIEINRLENVGDDLTHEAVAKLFKEVEVLDLIKLKEIYEYLEMATDKCEDAADVIKDIVIKNA